jgi:hypothetical protein
MPPDFPMTSYQDVEKTVSRYLAALGSDAASVPGFSGYAGGWNGLVIRFRAADEYAASAVASLTTLAGSPPNEDRFLQERDLFGFFANAVATVESCCFGIYHIGSMAKPEFFLKSPDEVAVKPTATAFAAAFTGSVLHTTLYRLLGDDSWRRLKTIRNLLIHQQSPGRTIYLGTAPYVPPPAEWTGLGLALDATLVEPHRRWLGGEVCRLIDATLDFVQAHLTTPRP